MEMAEPRIKTIVIKAGVVKRVAKEIAMYEKEAEKQREKIEIMKAELKDDHDVKKQEEVLQESIMMGPDCRRRLATVLNDLKRILDSEDDLSELDEFQTALKVVANAESLLQK